MTSLSDLQAYPLIYVATPYSKYPLGIEMAFRDAARLTATLLQEGLRVYSPIAHTHPIAMWGQLDPLDHTIWLPFDEAIMEKADALLVAMLDTWESSYGVSEEINIFLTAGKPIYFLHPKTLRVHRHAPRRQDSEVALPH